MKNTQKITIFIALVGIAATGILPVFSANYAYALYGRTSPIAYTQAAGNITSDSAVLYALINSGNVETMYWFEYGTTQSLGLRTDILSAGSLNYHVMLGQPINGLTPNTLYYYRVVAQNSYGRSTGKILTFATNAAPQAVSNIAVNSYQTNGEDVFSSVAQGVKVRDVNNSAPASIMGNQRAQECVLVASIALPQQAVAGDTLTYTLTYRNGCSYDLRDVAVKIIIPSGFTIESQSSGNITYTQDVYGVQYIIGTVPQNTQENILIQGRVDSSLNKGDALAFHAMFSYTDEKGKTRINDTYLNVPIVSNQGLTASIFDAFDGILQSGWFAALLLIIAAFLVFWAFFKKNRKMNDEEIDVLKA